MCFSCSEQIKTKTDILIEETPSKIYNNKSQEKLSYSTNERNKAPSPLESQKIHNKQPDTFKDNTINVKNNNNTNSVHFHIRPRTIKSNNAMLKGLRQDLMNNAF